MVSLDKLKSMIDYNANTGELTWSHANKNNTRKGLVAGTKHSNRYIRVCIFGELYQAHRLAWYIHYGKEPEYGIDHIDGDRFNNSISNLRDVPQSVNAKNTKLSKSNYSGVSGVTFMKKSERWRARVMVDGVDIHLGFYKSKDDAIKARLAANKEYGYHANHGRK